MSKPKLFNDVLIKACWMRPLELFYYCDSHGTYRKSQLGFLLPDCKLSDIKFGDQRFQDRNTSKPKGRGHLAVNYLVVSADGHWISDRHLQIYALSTLVIRAANIKLAEQFNLFEDN